MAVHEWLLWVMAVFLVWEMKYNIIKQRYTEWCVNLSIFLMFIGLILRMFILFYGIKHIIAFFPPNYLISFSFVLMSLNINIHKFMCNEDRKPVEVLKC